MKAALNMDRNGEHFLKDEYCFFDGKFKRCRNFVTLTASVYHPLLKGKYLLLLWKLNKRAPKTLHCSGLFLTRVYKKSQGTTRRYLCNPQGWCTNIARANMNGLQQVFGEDALGRIKSCEFYFKDSTNKMARKLGQEAGETLKELCQKLLTCSSKETYLEVKNS